MGRIAVLTPSKGNPDGVLYAFESMLATSTDTEMVVCVDESDRHEYGFMKMDRLSLFFGTPGSAARLVNEAARARPEFDVYGLMVDDATFVTPGWDRRVLDAFGGFRNGIGVVSPKHNVNDCVNFPYVGRRWIDALGWYACPDTLHYCWDTVLELLGEATALREMTDDEFYVRHEHIRPLGTGEKFMMDSVQFLNWCITKRKDAVRLLRKAMEE